MLAELVTQNLYTKRELSVTFHEHLISPHTLLICTTPVLFCQDRRENNNFHVLLFTLTVNDALKWLATYLHNRLVQI